MSSAVPPSRQVYQLVELRANILSRLDRPDLVTCLRIEKGCMEDVVRELYRKIPYDVARLLMKAKNPTANQLMYCRAVSTIDPDDYWRYGHNSLTPELLRGLGRNPIVRKKKREELMEELFDDYRADVFNVLVPPFRNTFPSLRELRFYSYSCNYGLPRWNVHFDAIRPADHATTGLLTSHDRGHIEYITEMSFQTWKDPPTTPPVILTPPSPLHPIRIRFDADFRSTSRTLSNKWRLALTEGGLLKDAHYVSFESCPIDMGILTALYQSQIDAGNAPLSRVHGIVSKRIATWALPDLRTFARIASTSITTFRTATPWNFENQLSFGDIPEFISVIQTLLPNLSVLQANMAGIDTAEEVCRGFLKESTLENGGSLSEVIILAARSETSMFNILRSLCPLTEPDAKLLIRVYTPGVDGPSEDSDEDADSDSDGYSGEFSDHDEVAGSAEEVGEKEDAELETEGSKNEEGVEHGGAEDQVEASDGAESAKGGGRRNGSHDEDFVAGEDGTDEDSGDGMDSEDEGSDVLNEAAEREAVIGELEELAREAETDEAKAVTKLREQDWLSRHEKVDESWSFDNQREFVDYIRRQTSARRAHLATLDFASIGITHPTQVLNITYDDDDRPHYDPNVVVEQPVEAMFPAFW